jgi:hypothetical protein
MSTGGIISDNLPLGWTYVSATGGTCVATAGGFDCTVGALVPGAMQTFNVIALVPDDHPITTVINSASIVANESDYNSGNDSDTETISVILPLPIPTLNQWGIVSLLLLIFTFGFVVLKTNTIKEKPSLTLFE